MKRYIITLTIVLAVFTNCRKKPDPVQPAVASTATLNISLQNMAGAKQLVLNTEWYKNENGDSLQITKFNYFISNIKLVKEDGTEYVQPESYYLIEEDKPVSHSFAIDNIPPGKYKAIKFLIGVDSARNVSGAQTGALDQSSGMFWDWNTGYVMAKMEAKSPQANDGYLIYHLGGYSGQYNMLRTVTLNMGEVVLDVNKKINIHLKADALEWFKTPTTISIKDLNIITNKTSGQIADNYIDMFTIDHID